MRNPLSILAILTLVGCAAGNPQTQGTHFTEVGAGVDGGNFGAAVRHNTKVMTGERSYALNLSNRFASEVLTTITFAFNSDRLDARARDTLARQAAWIRQFPEVRFTVYGHADKVGSDAYNKALGLRRARAVVDFLTAHGIGRERLDAVVSFGETQPLIVTQGRERRNRRTVTEVSGFVASNPIVLDGKYAEIIYRETIISAKPASDLQMADSVGLAAE